MIEFFVGLLDKPNGEYLVVFGAMAVAITCGLALGFVLTKIKENVDKKKVVVELD